MWARLRLVAALGFLLSAVMVGNVATAPAAQAASSGWQTAEIRIPVGIGKLEADWTCRASFRLVELSGTVYAEEASGGYCTFGPNLDPGYCGVGELPCTDIWWTMLGVGCSSVTLLPSLSETGSNTNKRITMGAYTTSAIGTCDPTEVCVYVEYTGVGNDETRSGCTTLGLDPPTVTDPATTCPYVYAAPTGAWSTLEDKTLFYSGTSYYSQITNTYVQASALSSGTWVMYAIYNNKTKAAEPAKPGSGAVYGTGGVPNTDGGEGHAGGFVGGGWTTWMNPADTTLKQFGALGAGGSGITNNLPGDGRVSAKTGHVNPVRYPGTALHSFSTPPAPNMTSIAKRDLTGVGIFRAESWGGVELNNTNTGTGFWQLPSHTNMATNAGVVGVTNPSRCAWYFGSKVWSNSSLVEDEPAGTVLPTPPEPPEEPPDEDPPPLPDPPADPPDDTGLLQLIANLLRWIGQVLVRGFEGLAELLRQIRDGIYAMDAAMRDGLQDVVDAINDIATDVAEAVGDAISNTWNEVIPDGGGGGGGLSPWALLKQLLALIGDLFELIGGLVASLVEAIGDLIEGLFVPTDVQGHFDTMEAAWSESGPGQFIGGFSEMGVVWPSGSDCGGVPVDLDIAGVAVDFNLGEACTGAAANAATIVRNVASAGIVIFGGLACLRAIGAGFGWSPGVGRGEA